ncbi:kinase-like protein [Ascodesmis nigricans]|uniref:mitogen-activated protein kinase kinase n=1 Tax=Ascodesmis nigricans TaxID=341454 RepID=A0A4S2MQ80_9PEZI|nr:kinase-like protein [Ascodesmis nigricans]
MTSTPPEATTTDVMSSSPTDSVPSQPPSLPPPTPATSDVPPRTVSPSIPRSMSDPCQNSAPNPIAHVQTARRPPTFANGLPKDLAERMKNFHSTRMGQNPGGVPGIPSIPSMNRQMPGPPRPHQPNWASETQITGAGRGRGGIRRANAPGGLSAMNLGMPPTGPPGANGGTPKKNRPHLGSLAGSGILSPEKQATGSKFDQFAQYVDAKTGSLKFAGKAVLHGKGVEFSSGSKFMLSLDELQTLEELGKGNYGTVYRVIRKDAAAGARRGSFSRESSTVPSSDSSSGDPTPDEQDGSSLPRNATDPLPGTVMAMKEIRLELDENKFAQIIMELDVLHKCRSPYIIDFYGAFFQEGAVYICMEHMDGGSIDKLYQGGVSEGVLRKIAFATVMGLKTLKDDHNIIHRDVKPTNILVNTRGEIKLCDFGVSGNLVASIAKTNIGCQSYMAPERIATGGTQAVGAAPGTYGVQSDIWSLGLSLLECAMGCYPYPPETYNNIFSQLSAIVDGEPPDLPPDTFSESARAFVRDCLHKVPNLRPSYATLLTHRWIEDLNKPTAISEEAEEEAEKGADFHSRYAPERGDEEVKQWVRTALDRRDERLKKGVKGPEKPALHAAPLDAVSPVQELEERLKVL